MNKRDMPLVLIILSVGLILYRFFTTDQIDRSFFINILSNVLLIIAMVVTIQERNKNL